MNEKSLIGSILAEPKSIYKISQQVEPKHFADQNLARYYQAMLKIAENGAPSVDAVVSELENTKIVDGDRTKLYELNCIVPSGTNIKRYADEVCKEYRVREIKRIGHSLSQIKAEDDNCLNEAAKLVISASVLNDRFNFTGNDVLDRYFNSLDDPKKFGVPTNIPSLDALLGGLKVGTLNTLAARPAVGKSAMALGIALHALLNGKRVAIFSLEMTVDEVGLRLASILTGMEMNEILANPTDKKVSHAYGEIAKLPLVVNDNPNMTPDDCLLECYKLKCEGELDLVIVDYLQIMSVKGKQESRLQEVSKMTRNLKNMAKELEVPVLLLSQLSRAGVETPKLHHLRDSGTIEQDSNVVILIDRPCADPDVRINMPLEQWNKAKLILAKNRGGGTGTIQMTFDGKTASFKELTTKYE